MPEYRVKWEIDVEAESPRHAAELAREAQIRPDTQAVVFDVQDPLTMAEPVRIDLNQPTNARGAAAKLEVYEYIESGSTVCWIAAPSKADADWYANERGWRESYGGHRLGISCDSDDVATWFKRGVDVVVFGRGNFVAAATTEEPR